MNRLHADAFESLDDRVFQMTVHLRELLNGEISIEDLEDVDLLEPDGDE